LEQPGYRFRGAPGFAAGQHPVVPGEEISLEIVQAMRQQAYRLLIQL